MYEIDVNGNLLVIVIVI